MGLSVFCILQESTDCERSETKRTGYNDVLILNQDLFEGKKGQYEILEFNIHEPRVRERATYLDSAEGVLMSSSSIATSRKFNFRPFDRLASCGGQG